MENLPKVSSKQITSELIKIINQLDTETNPITPLSFIKSLSQKLKMFELYKQQDCSEFITLLLNILNEELKEKKEIKTEPSSYWTDYLYNNNSPITNIFYGLLKHQVQCFNCLTETVSFEPFNCLSVFYRIISSYPFQTGKFLYQNA